MPCHSLGHVRPSPATPTVACEHLQAQCPQNTSRGSLATLLPSLWIELNSKPPQKLSSLAHLQVKEDLTNRCRPSPPTGQPTLPPTPGRSLELAVERGRQEPKRCVPSSSKAAETVWGRSWQRFWWKLVSKNSAILLGGVCSTEVRG